MSKALEIPKDYVCPISLQLMTDPVIDCNGHTFDRPSITEWYQKSKISPITHVSITNNNLTPNLILKRQILEFVEQHREELKNLDTDSLQSSIKIEESNYQPPNIEVKTQIVTQSKSGVIVNVDTTQVDNTSSHRHLILLVDESASMDQTVEIKNDSDEEIDYGLTLLDVVRHSVQTLVNILLEDNLHQYYLTIITFTGEAERECVFLKVDNSNKGRFNRIIEGFSAKQATNIWDAFRLSFQTIEELNESPLPIDHQVILFTDGVPNRHPFTTRNGEYTPEQYFESIQNTIERKQIRCRISTIGFGRNQQLDSELLSGIANRFSGNFGFISDTSMLSTTWLYIIANLIHETTVNLPEILYKQNGSLKTMKLKKLMNGQTRYVFLPGQEISDIKLKYQGSDGKTYHQNSISNTCVKIKQDWLLEKTRYDLCEVLEQILNYMSINQTNEAQQVLENFKTKIQNLNDKIKSPILGGYLEDIVTSDQAHDGGQLSMAFSQPSYYNDWGSHYLRALHNAHLTKCKSNFKDHGLNYDTPTIQQTIKNMETIFMDMPPPKASRQNRGTVQMQSSQVLYNQGGGCFHPDCLVTTASGTTFPVSKIKKGDLLRTPNGTARVICVTQIIQPPDKISMCNLGNNTLITPYHPIIHGGRWIFPKDYYPIQDGEIDRVYNFVLDRHHQIYINDIQTVTFGHNLTGNVIEHPFFGTNKIIKDLKKFSGYDRGQIILYWSYFKRNTKTNLIETIEKNNQWFHHLREIMTRYNGFHDENIDQLYLPSHL